MVVAGRDGGGDVGVGSGEDDKGGVSVGGGQRCEDDGDGEGGMSWWRRWCGGCRRLVAESWPKMVVTAPKTLRRYVIALEKTQPDVIYKVCLEILKQYSFFNAFTRTADSLEIYMQLFWHTVTYELTAKTYFFTLDDQIFEVNAYLPREALQITPKDYDHPFIKPPFEKEIISFINRLGYPETLTRISDMATNTLYQPWRTFMTMIDICLTGKASGFDRPWLALLQILWGMVTIDEIKASDDYAEYLTKSLGTKRAKTRGKRLLTKKGVEVAVERVSIPKRRRLNTMIKETDQSEEVANVVDSEETKEEEEPLIRRRPTGEGSGIALEVPDEINLKGPNEGSGVTLVVLKEPSGSLRSSSLEYEIKDISNDDESDGAEDEKKAYDSKTFDRESYRRIS
uniref:Monodehydroascorbate reductase n=1 Tax=Tanacetum cinerariifolium TaxID=118510 RepID=A0A6L2NML6_TANCI|nr:hypothetical protein [Tanacetum cinerariifolium]